VRIYPESKHPTYFQSVDPPLLVQTLKVHGLKRYDLKLWITHLLGGATYLPR
jgi:hypothetical protein